MTTNLLIGYAAAASMTITLNSLASSGTAGRQSTVVDNSSTKYDDALLEVSVAYPNSAPANDKAVYVFAFGSTDGSNYPESLTATDAAFTIAGVAGALTTSLSPIGVLMPIQNTTKRYGPFSVAKGFDGILPQKWGIVVLNYSGQTLSASNNSVQYAGIYWQGV